MAERPGTAGPWRSSDVLRYTLAQLVAVIGVLSVAWGTVGNDDIDTQVAWLNGGVAAVIVSGATNVLWLLAGRRSVGERRMRLLPSPRAALADGAVVHEKPHAATTGEPVASARMTRYHRPDCALVAGKVVAAGKVEAHRAAGRQPCGMCEP